MKGERKTNKNQWVPTLLIIMILLMVFSTGCIANRDSKDTERLGTEEMLHDGQERTYNIHVPSSYDPSVPTPLVIALHAWGENAFIFEKRTGFSDKADEEGFIVIYPDGIKRSWNAGFCCGGALKNDVDDVGFIRALLEKTMNDYEINSSRIYVMGHSNGGMMSYTIGSELSDIVAAIGPVSGTIGTDSRKISDPDHPVSVIALNGMNDPLVDYDGNIMLGAEESVSFWVDHNNCSTTPQSDESENGKITIDTYSEGDDGTEVVLYSIVNAGHNWPFDRPIDGISQTDIMWEFFEDHPKQ
jgi:polyhydroxybutyrate depolymerase